MSTNHQMNYYDYAKTLSAEGNMTALIGGGSGTEPETDYVDLGLSVKWAKCNIGANTPEEAGLYFAWGETSGYTAEQVGTDKNFTWEDYQWGNPNSSTLVTDGLIDENGNLKPEYDAATANWGEGWRMPTKEEFEELLTLPHTWDSSRSGYSFTDANGNELLFIFAGGFVGNGNVDDLGEAGDFWSGSLLDDGCMYAWRLYFNIDDCYVGQHYRFIGNTVRPVLPKNI